MEEVLEMIKRNAVKIVDEQIKKNKRNVTFVLTLMLSHLYALEHTVEVLLKTLEEIEKKGKIV